LWSSVLWRRVVLWVDINVLEQHTITIFTIDLEDGDSMLLQNVAVYLQDYTAPQVRRLWSEHSPPWVIGEVSVFMLTLPPVHKVESIRCIKLFVLSFFLPPFLPSFCWFFSLVSCFPLFFLVSSFRLPRVLIPVICERHVHSRPKSLFTLKVCAAWLCVEQIIRSAFKHTAKGCCYLCSLRCFCMLTLRYKIAPQKVGHALAYTTTWSARDPSMHCARDDVVLHDLCSLVFGLK
jgi:hypothetical protein